MNYSAVILAAGQGTRMKSTPAQGSSPDPWQAHGILCPGSSPAGYPIHTGDGDRACCRAGTQSVG